MQSIDVTRRENLGRLIKESGSQAALSSAIGKAPAQISQWLNSSLNSRTKKPRVMSSAIAREIEKKTGKPDGWMDHQQANAQKMKTAEFGFTRSAYFQAKVLQSLSCHANEQSKLFSSLNQQEIAEAYSQASSDLHNEALNLFPLYPHEDFEAGREWANANGF